MNTSRSYHDREGASRFRVLLLQRVTGVAAERVIELSTLGVQNRIHAELLRLAREAGSGGTQARIDPAPKHADIASQVSTYREQVTREISALARRGLVARQGGALVLLDVPKLEQIVADVRGNARKLDARDGA